ncbi:MAG: alanine racemase [Candidatus Aminicenantes bacterium]|jgi:alanine racemase
MAQTQLQWVEIDRWALEHNIRQFRSLIGNSRKMTVVVKSNAYGHGLLEISHLASEFGADWLGVNSLEEALAIRKSGIGLTLILLGYVPVVELEEAVKNDLRLTVYNTETIEELGRVTSVLKKNVYLHIKTETGVHRQGIRGEELLPFIEKIRAYPYLEIEGLSMHFANIEDTTDHSYAQQQLELYMEYLDLLGQNSIDIPVKHVACSAATILFPETFFDMVRVGIGVYGLWPSKETYLSCIQNEREPVNIKPVLSWKTRVVQIKEVPEGAFIGYGCTYKTTRPTKLAVIPVGYYDGYDRLLSNASYVLISGKRAPVRGRVAMNFITADVTDVPGVKLEDEVVLLGQQGQEHISAEYLASLCGTINYEIVTRINPKISRIVV